MNNDFFAINHDRLIRLIAETGIKATPLWDDLTPAAPLMHFIRQGEKYIHAIPCYNLDNVDSRKYVDFFCKSDAYTAMIPAKSEALELDLKVTYIERPSLMNLTICENCDIQWNLVHKSKQRVIKKLRDQLVFGVAEGAGDIKRAFVKSYVESQLLRSTPITQFFDAKALNAILELSESMLFYVYDKLNPSSILFHLNFFSCDTSHYLFSSSTTAESRTYSSSLHWFIIERLIAEERCTQYSLGGGLSKGDGIETFKSHLGATREKRLYGVYPTERYNPDEFFPASHKFLAQAPPFTS